MSQNPPQDPNDRAGNFIVFFPMGSLVGAVLYEFSGSLWSSVTGAFLLAILLLAVDYARDALKKWAMRE